MAFPSLQKLGVSFLLFVVANVYGADTAATPSSSTEIRYNRDIRPILSDNCFACHGQDKNARKAKLRLDVREVALEKEAIVPGKAEESELVKRIFATDPDDLMPPPDSHKQLSAAQKDLLKRWIAEGAKYEPHWAYIKPSRAEVPKTKNADWVKNPIDAFILQTLEAHSIQPSPEADKRTLLRRLSLDLTGLPPTPAEIAAFLADKDAKAYEHQLDRLLSSPHYGERMATPWLDLARFTDTVGYHGDQNQNVFAYRDYVIESFNKNKPFDQFTIEQLAGDLLPQPTTEQRIATGFNRLNMVTREGGAQPGEYLAKYAADRVRTVATTWLGSTMGCCECHDHKFDPFSTKDFYSMEAFFADIKQWGVYQDYGYTPNPDLKGWSNDHPFPPEIEVDSPYLHRRIQRLDQQIEEVKSAGAAKLANDASEQSAFDDWCRQSLAFLQANPSGWNVPPPSAHIIPKDAKTPPATTVALGPDGKITFEGKPGENIEITLPLSAGWLSAICLELLPSEEHHGGIVREGESTTINFEARLQEGDQKKKLSYYDAEADHKEDRYSNGYAIIGVKDAWRTSIKESHSPQTAVWQLNQPVQVKEGSHLIVSLGKGAVGCVRVSVSPLANDDLLKPLPAEPLLHALQTEKAKRTASEQNALYSAYLLSTGHDAEAFTQFKKLHALVLECRGGRTPTLVTVAWEPKTTRVLRRGNWQDEGGDVVQPQPPHFLPQPKSEERRLNRLDLARWLVSTENPLTARTVVNRLWKQFFGAGICSTVDDLGLQGDTPSHPELLDWLAVEFMESGWDIKHIVRLIAMSSAYRQDSNLRPELKDIDPNNRLLASQNPRRLEAEFVRDNALFIAGLLNEEVGGPSAFPYQPAGYYANLQFPDRDYHAQLDEREYRRGVYTHWQRTFLHPMLANFDAPAREECTANRTVSNTPQQALTLLNDPSFVEAARVLAQKLTAVKQSDDDRLEAIFQRALARSVRSNEKTSLKDFLTEQRAHYKSSPDEAHKVLHVGIASASKETDEAELAAWTSVCRVVLNLHETITTY